MTLLEGLAALTAALGVGLAVWASAWSWPLTLVSCGLYAWFFWREKLFADALLQGGFAVLCVVGWRQWRRGSAADSLPITRAPIPELFILAGLTTLAALGWGWWLTHTSDPVPWLDAALTAASLAGQWLLTRKRLENWLVWLVVDAAYVALFATRGYWPTTILYGLFLGLAAAGWWRWQQRVGQPS